MPRGKQHSGLLAFELLNYYINFLSYVCEISY